MNAKSWLKMIIQTRWFAYLFNLLKRALTGKMTIYEIVPNLYQSSKFSSEDFDTIFKLNIEVVIDLEGGEDEFPSCVKQYKYWPIRDELKLPDLTELKSVVDYGYAMWKLNGKRTLVHCSAGCNRSGLINGLILVRDGWSGINAVSYIRKKVPAGLTNVVFADYVENAK